MPLTPGTNLSQYEVVEAIGEGGMGEVYRARDTKLGRDVAIKVLPEEFARDQERLDRFEREARLLAQVNHANIATLHGLEEHDGQKFIVMELVEGETLAERIESGPIPVDEAIPLFIQIAEGLEAAHEKAIVHRDLKPANVKIGPDGKPKILDFGLAKAFVGEERISDSSQSPTLTKGTALGAIMGTASYMSPEQARGAALDKKTDIWAFGCCLYEALTGNKAFDGDSATDILAAVVKTEPEWKALDAETPARVRELIVRCLRKTPSKRVHDIADARLQLEACVDEPPREPIRSGRWSTSALVSVGLICAMAAVGLATLLSSNRRDAPRPLRRLSANVLPSASGGGGPSWAISPDGSAVVSTTIGGYGTRGRLYIRRLDETGFAPLVGTENATTAFFSPMGNGSCSRPAAGF